MLWQGGGSLLLSQKATDPKTKKFLESVPKHLNDIREVHGASVTGDLAVLQDKAASCHEEVFGSRDRRGLTPLHKAVGLDKRKAAEFLLAKNPGSLSCADCEGRTPLHYAALVGEQAQGLYDWLVEQGAEVAAKDKAGRTAEECLGQQQQEEESQAWERADSLMEVPEAPRLGQSARKGSPSKRTASRSKSPVKKTGPRAASKLTKQDRLVKLITWQEWTVAQVEEMAKAGKVAALEAVVLGGQAHLLEGLGKVWNEEVRSFLKKAPALRKEVEEAMTLVLQGDTEGVAAVTDPRLLVARDTTGTAPIHRAARLAHLEIVSLILAKLPQAVKTVDPLGRTPLHWAYRCEDGLGRERVVGLLQAKGADRGAKDGAGHTPDFYLENDFVEVKVEVGDKKKEGKKEEGEVVEAEKGKVDRAAEEEKERKVSIPATKKIPPPTPPLSPPPPPWCSD